MKRVYELNEAEQALIEGFRRGQIVLNEEWLRLSEKEREAVLLWRQIEFGPITFQLKDGEPIRMEAVVHARLGCQEDKNRVALVEKLRLIG